MLPNIYVHTNEWLENEQQKRKERLPLLKE